MHTSSLLRHKWPVLTALLLIILAAGCGDNKSTNPTPKPAPSPSLAMTLHDTSGLFNLTVKNTGGPMKEPSPFVADYADGHQDTLMLSLDSNETLSCQLSNIHGAVAVTNDEWSLSANGEDCLCRYFQDVLAGVKLADHVPSPLNVSTVVLCTYTTYLKDLAANDATVELTRTAEGLTLKYVFHDISGQLTSISPGALCPDLSGSLTITSIVVTTTFDISDGDNPQVTLNSTQVKVNGLSVNVDGTFGFIVSYVLQWFQDSFTATVANAFGTAFAHALPSDLNTLVIVKSSCSN